MLLQFDLLGDEGIFEFFELGNIKRAIGKAVVDPVDLGFDLGLFGFQPVNLFLFGLGFFALPCFNPGQKPFLPFIGNGGQLRVSLHLVGKNLLADELAVFAAVFLVFVRATIIHEAETALFGVPLSGDAEAARAASGKIKKQKLLFLAASVWFGNGNQCGLDFVKGFLADHRDMQPLVHLPFVQENAVIEGIAEHVADGGERHFRPPFRREFRHTCVRSIASNFRFAFC